MFIKIFMSVTMTFIMSSNGVVFFMSVKIVFANVYHVYQKMFMSVTMTSAMFIDIYLNNFYIYYFVIIV